MTEKKSPPPAADLPAVRRARRSKGGYTLRDVAKLAGVAPITASRALNTPSAVSPAVLERVREAVERIGYVPNMLAGGLASKRSRLVAAVIPTITGSIFLEMVQSLTQTLADSGYQLMLGQTGYENSREDALLETIIGRRPDGVVLTGIMRSGHGRKRLINSGIPIVETWDMTSTPIDMLVGFSHEKMGVEVAQFLHARGRRRVAMISANDERAIRRNKAFAEPALARGMAPPGATEVPSFIVPAPTSMISGRTGLRSLIAQYPDIDAIFCSSDLVALGVMIEAGVLGMAIPDRLAVIGLGDLDMSRDFHPALTTVRIDGTRIGSIAGRFIIDRAEERPVETYVQDIGFSIVERGTT